MVERKRFEQNIARDAVLVHAAMHGLFEPAAFGLGLSPDEAFVHHPKWLKRQGDAYLRAVASEVAKMGDS